MSRAGRREWPGPRDALLATSKPHLCRGVTVTHGLLLADVNAPSDLLITLLSSSRQILHDL